MDIPRMLRFYLGQKGVDQFIGLTIVGENNPRFL